MLVFLYAKSLGAKFYSLHNRHRWFFGELRYYNSYLPEIADPENQNKVSARGFSMGYLGSSLLLIICLVGIMVFKYEETVVDGVVVSTKGFFKVKYAFLLTGLWWMGFAQYTFKHLPAKVHTAHGNDTKGLIWKGFKELRSVFIQIRSMVELRRLIAISFTTWAFKL